MNQDYFSVQETCEILHIQRSTLLSWEKNGVFPKPKFGHHGFTRRREIPFSSIQKMAAHRLKWFNRHWQKILGARRWSHDLKTEQCWLGELADGNFADPGRLSELALKKRFLPWQEEMMAKTALRLPPRNGLRLTIWIVLMSNEIKSVLK